MKVFLKVNFFLFPFLWTLAFVFSALESLTYSGFLPGTRIFLVLALLSGLLVRIIPQEKKTLQKWLDWHKTLFAFNRFFFPLLLVTTAIVLFLEDTHYPNYVFNIIHLQPSLFSWLCLLSGFLVFLDLGRLEKRWSLKRLPQKGEFTSGQFKLLPYRLFAVLLLVFAIYNSVILIKEFYQDEFRPENEIEIQYASRKINIYQWVEKRFPRMKDFIFWCGDQQEEKELDTLDPSVIWSSTEGLMRVFMTNCRYKQMDIINLPANESLTYLKKKGDSFWLVSINECEEERKATVITRQEDEVEYLRQVNNDIICSSEQILPGLYRFSLTE